MENYVIWTHRFAARYPVLDNLRTIAIQSNAKFESVFESDQVNSDDEDTGLTKKQRKLNSQTIEVNGLDPINNLAEVFGTGKSSVDSMTMTIAQE